VSGFFYLQFSRAAGSPQFLLDQVPKLILGNGGLVGVVGTGLVRAALQQFMGPFFAKLAANVITFPVMLIIRIIKAFFITFLEVIKSIATLISIPPTILSLVYPPAGAFANTLNTLVTVLGFIQFVLTVVGVDFDILKLVVDLFLMIV